MNEASASPAVTLVRVEHVSFSYGETPALRDVSLELRAGEFIALVGRNGSGKTTLAKHLNGLLRPSSGRVLVGPAGSALETRHAPVGELARQVGYVFQNPDHQLFLPTVRREIAYGPQQLGLSGAALEARVAETLERFELGALAERHPAELGRGVRRLTALAAIYAMGPGVLVLDEPTGGLDRRLTARLIRLLNGLAADGHAIVLITHEMWLVAECARRVIVLRDGAVVADAAPAQLLGDEQALAGTGLRPPPVARLAGALRPAGVPTGVVTVDALCGALLRLLAPAADAAP